jgi:hypothetical protein
MLAACLSPPSPAARAVLDVTVRDAPGAVKSLSEEELAPCSALWHTRSRIALSWESRAGGVVRLDVRGAGGGLWLYRTHG